MDEENFIDIADPYIHLLNQLKTLEMIIRVLANSSKDF